MNLFARIRDLFTYRAYQLQIDIDGTLALITPGNASGQPVRVIGSLAHDVEPVGSWSFIAVHNYDPISARDEARLTREQQAQINTWLACRRALATPLVRQECNVHTPGVALVMRIVAQQDSAWLLKDLVTRCAETSGGQGVLRPGAFAQIDELRDACFDTAAGDRLRSYELVVPVMTLDPDLAVTRMCVAKNHLIMALENHGLAGDATRSSAS